MFVMGEKDRLAEIRTGIDDAEATNLDRIGRICELMAEVDSLDEA